MPYSGNRVYFYESNEFKIKQMKIHVAVEIKFIKLVLYNINM
jgi:hypothetical protein